MFLKIILLSYLSVALAGPYHKNALEYILDVGNEELKKNTAEQLRVSVSGGSVSLRRPAAGEGHTITHVRVSGIDLGADVRANILEGGPGYKYVTIGLEGKPDVAYNAVITIRSVRDELRGFQTTTVGNEAGDDLGVKKKRQQDLEEINFYKYYKQNEISDRMDTQNYPFVEDVDYMDESNKADDLDDEKDHDVTSNSIPVEIGASYNGRTFAAVDQNSYGDRGVTYSANIEDQGGYTGDSLEVDQLYNDEEVHNDNANGYRNDNSATHESSVVES